jgi:hypothetical protein
MKATILTTLALGFCGIAAAVADEPKVATDDRSHVVKFLKDHVIGKTVATPKSIHKLDHDTMESKPRTTSRSPTSPSQLRASVSI